MNYIGIILGFIIVMSIMLFIQVGKKDDFEINSLVDQYSETERVFIEDLHALDTSMGAESEAMIEKGLYSTVVQDGKDLFTGKIQPGSYKVKLVYTPTGNVRIRSLRVEVEPAKITYIVTLREHPKSRSVSVACAAKELQVNPSAVCKESIWM